jgi:hypothetical protein
VHAKWRFEQMIPVLGHFGVYPGVGVLQDDVLDSPLPFRL